MRGLCPVCKKEVAVHVEEMPIKQPEPGIVTLYVCKECTATLKPEQLR